MMQIFSQASLVLFGLFGMSALISKSLFTVLYAIAVIFGLYKFQWNIILQRSLLEKWLMLLFPLAVVVSFFSIGGSDIALEVASRWTWPLIYFPIVYLHQNKEPRAVFFKGLALGLFLACLYSYARFFTEYANDFNPRVASFWDLLRWAYFCAVAVVILFAVLLKKDLLDKKMWRMMLVLLLMTLVSLLLTGSRGAWMGTLAGAFICLISQKKSWTYYASFIAIIFLLMLSNSGVRDRVFSSFNVQRNGDKITSKDMSNAGRLGMWKVATDLYKEVPFFGVGFQNTKPALEEFIARQGPDYAQAYTLTEYSYNDQHSSYLSLLLQFGGVYSICIYGFLFLATFKGRRDDIYIPAIMCTYVVYFFYSGIVSFESVLMFGMMAFVLLREKAQVKE